jgi:hypothetical protein
MMRHRAPSYGIPLPPHAVAPYKTNGKGGKTNGRGGQNTYGKGSKTDGRGGGVLLEPGDGSWECSGLPGGRVQPTGRWAKRTARGAKRTGRVAKRYIYIYTIFLWPKPLSTRLVPSLLASTAHHSPAAAMARPYVPDGWTHLHSETVTEVPQVTAKFFRSWFVAFLKKQDVGKCRSG